MTRPYCCLDRSPPSPARVRRENLGQPRAGRPLSWAGSEPLPPTPTLRPAEMRRNLEDTQVALRGSADHLVVVDLVGPAQWRAAQEQCSLSPLPAGRSFDAGFL